MHFIGVMLDGARSVEPPMNPGVTLVRALRQSGECGCVRTDASAVSPADLPAQALELLRPTHCQELGGYHARSCGAAREPYPGT